MSDHKKLDTETPRSRNNLNKMDTSKFPPLSPASPGRFLFPNEQPPFQPLIQPMPVGGDISNTPESYQSLREKWESLKPLIQCLYMEENKPFPYLAGILRDEHGFQPSKRMFDRQIAKWGFRKNISRAERRDLLLKLPGDGSTSAPESIDRRLKPGKLKNWQRRYNEEELGVPLALVQQGEPQRNVIGPDLLLDRSLGGISNLPEPSLEHVGELSPDPNFVNDGTGEVQISQEHEMILDWSTLDVPGSPKLSRLFKALEIESSKPLPPISLDNTTSDSEEPTCLSDVEMRDLFNKDNEGLAVDMVLPRSSYREQEPFQSLTSDSSSQHIHYPWRDIKAVFCGYRSPSPFNEVYVFPPSRTFGRAPRQIATLWASRQMEEAELEAKFGKLKKQFPIHHAAVVALMEDLADIYNALEKYQKAETLYRSLVDMYRRTSGPTNLKTLLACQKVIETIMGQGQWSEAQSLNQNLQSTISKLVSPHHELAIWARWADGCLARALGQNERAEILRREHLQIMLCLNGPRHTDTINAVNQLVYEIAKIGPGEAEKLARNAVQICLGNPTADEETCSTMGVLVNRLYSSSKYLESCSIAKNVMEKFSDSLGLDHTTLLEIRTDLAWSMLMAGKLAESEELFRDLDSRHPQDERQPNSKLNIWAGLARALKKLGKVDEAITWYEKSFQTKLASYGACSSITVKGCSYLGLCYENQGRYDDALRLYRKMISSIKDTIRDKNDEQDPNELIAKVERWIRRRRLQKRTNNWEGFKVKTKENHCKGDHQIKASEDGG